MQSMRASVVSVFCVATALVAAQGLAANPSIRIMPLGDSITHGTPVPGGYRAPLYTLLTNAGYNVDFVGTASDNGAATLPDSNHEGHGGWRIDGLYNNVYGWFESIQDPHVILLHIGTNDSSNDPSFSNAVTRLNSLVTRMAVCQPSARIIVTSLMKRNGTQYTGITNYFNPYIPGLVASQAALGRNVTFLDMHAFLELSDMSDGLHPNAGGYAKMATAWLGAITNLVTATGVTPNQPAMIRAAGSNDHLHVSLTLNKAVTLDTATNAANYAIDNGLSVTAAALSANRRTLTLTTTAQSAGTPYTLTVNNVLDDDALTLSGQITFKGVTPRGYANNVPESSEYRLIYSLDIPSTAGYLTNAPAYATDNAWVDEVPVRVAYYLELQGSDGDLKYAWVSMSAFTNREDKLGVPTLASGAVFQRTVTNLNIVCNVDGVLTGTGLNTGNLEFWPSNYDATNILGLAGASDTACDFGDRPTAGTYGCMQIHNYGAGQTLLAFNNWGSSAGATPDLGIGSNPSGSPDWTFMGNAGSYTVKTLQVLVLPGDPVPPTLVSALSTTNYNSVAITFGKPVERASATNIANYAINNGLTIHGASLSANARTVTLSTSLQTATATYTVTVNNVADQTAPSPLMIAADSQIAFIAPRKRGYLNNAAESSAYTLVYSLEIPNSANYGTNKVGYSVDNSASVGPFSRIAYYLELQKPGEDLQFLWASMDAFASDAGKIGVPTVLAGALYKQNVDNMNVVCSVPGVVNGSGLATGNIEFWPSNYGTGNGAGLPGANGGAFDFDDSGYSLTAGHGCMQLHNYGAGQTLFGLNNWNGSTLGLGIGNNTDFSKNGTPYPDWTFSANASIYSVKRFQVLVLQDPAADTAAPAIVSAQAGAAGTLVTVVFSERLAAASVNGARFALDNGVSVLNATLLRDGKTVLLTTTSLPAGTALTLTVNGVRDLCANVIPEGTTATVAAAALPASILANAGGLADGFQVVYGYDLPAVGDFNGSAASLICDQSDFAGAFDRVAYYVELVLPSGTTQYLWAAMNPIATTPKKLGIPTFASGEIYQQTVTNLDVKCNVSGVVNGMGLTTGNIEFWPYDYSQGNALSIPNANGGTYDFGDTRSTGGSHGCMQIHNYGASQTLFAINNFGGDGRPLAVGIGNNPSGSPDWTLSDNANSYARRTLYVLVRPKTASDLPAEIAANAGALASGFRRVYTLDIPVKGNFIGSSAAYRNISYQPAEAFDRIAYYAELVTAGGTTQYLWAAMDAFTNNAAKIAVPTPASGAIYQQKVSNLDVKSNVPGVVNGTGLTTGNIEFWPNDYSANNTLGIPNANEGTYDFGDTRSAGGGYGCMQIHNHGASQTLFAMNNWGGDGRTLCIGIGNNPSGSPDWTFADNAASYSRRTLHILVRPNPAPAADPLRAPAEVTANVPEAANWQLAYAIDLPVNGSFDAAPAQYYTVNNTTNGLTSTFSRIAYYLALQSGAGVTQYVWTAMDAFTNSASALGVPVNGIFFQQRVSRLDVRSNAGGIVTGTGLDTGNIEFWPSYYGNGNGIGIPNASGSTYDFGDSGGSSSGGGFGCMQVHNFGASQTLFAINHFNGGNVLSLGIGNNTNFSNDPTPYPDWTFANNAGSYNYRRLYVFVLPNGDAADLTRPALFSAAPSKTLNRVAVTFSEPLADSAANPAFFTLNNGVAVTGASLSADKRAVLLTTTALTAGQAYTVSVTGVRDRSVNGNLVIAGSSTSFTTATTPRSTALNNVPEAAGYELISCLTVSNTVAYSVYGCPYSADESLYAKPFTFDRVAYFMELSTDGITTNWVYVSMDAFTADLSKIGVPTAPRGAAFKSYVTNMNVYASAGANVTTGTGITTGLIEFWPSNYSPNRNYGLANASDSAYDFDDSGYNTSAGHGSMQIHNHAAAQTIFAFNQYGSNWRTPALGIGTRASATDPDWTVAANAASYAVKNIYVLARRGNTPAGLVTGTLPAIWTQPVSVEALSGSPIMLRVIASNAISYQWRKDGVWIPGATQSWLAIDPTACSDSGSYDVLAFGSGTACTTSQAATVTIRPYGTLFRLK
ncbi:MAG TPA: Ig-like domain-containing protein [Kiritimatiellia bacterium]|nr:Ig-like domain-containing protein [Kiritimatiellia bacterium]HPS07599.1 Ig-like domain-containing protein [Kiritimatiellia bacterium]